ncbi:hypothetical protein [Demequina sp.]|uniref:hypothetical protein n=1 Tax=Demequina sp. TaxID=2050685 RepID=UPI003A89D248
MSFTARPARVASFAAAAALALSLTACATEEEPATPTTEATDAHAEEGHDHDEATEEHSATENSSKTPRIVATYDGGIAVIDAATLETVSQIELAGFNRLASAGDGRHVAVSTTGGWAILDAGTWSQAHGDHFHYYTADPALSGVLIEAEIPGHVVVEDDLVALFDDGTGHVVLVEADEWTDMVEHGHAHAIGEYTTAAAHHGVAVATDEDTLYVTVGTEDGRTGAMLVEDGEVVVESDKCPGVHGETAFELAEETMVAFGCEDGVLLFHGEHAHKIDAPDAYGRTGNLFSSDESNVILGDYKTDPEGGLGLSQITLTNVEDETLTVVDPFAGADALYTWRGLTRGEDGEVLVLGTDGALRVIDPATGEVTTTIDVIDAWGVPEEWQTAHPSLTVLEGMAYVTDPAAGTITAVDYVGGEVWKSAESGIAFNEVVGVTG